MLYACPNSYASHSSPHRGGDPHVVAVSYGHADAHTDADAGADCDAHPDAGADCDAHSDASADCDSHPDTSLDRNAHSHTVAHCDLHASTYGDFYPGSNGDLLANADADSHGYPVADTYSNPHAAARRPEMEVPHSELGGCRSGGLGRGHLHRFTGPESIRIR